MKIKLTIEKDGKIIKLDASDLVELQGVLDALRSPAPNYPVITNVPWVPYPCQDPQKPFYEITWDTITTGTPQFNS